MLVWISVYVREPRDPPQDLFNIALNITEIAINFVLFNSVVFQHPVCVFNILVPCCLHTIILISCHHWFHCKTSKQVLFLVAVCNTLHTSLAFLLLLACMEEGMKPVSSSGLYCTYSHWFVSSEECANHKMVYQGNAFVKIYFQELIM